MIIGNVVQLQNSGYTFDEICKILTQIPNIKTNVNSSLNVYININLGEYYIAYSHVSKTLIIISGHQNFTLNQIWTQLNKDEQKYLAYHLDLFT